MAFLSHAEFGLGEFAQFELAREEQFKIVSALAATAGVTALFSGSWVQVGQAPTNATASAAFAGNNVVSGSLSAAAGVTPVFSGGAAIESVLGASAAFTPVLAGAWVVHSELGVAALFSPDFVALVDALIDTGANFTVAFVSGALQQGEAPVQARFQATFSGQSAAHGQLSADAQMLFQPRAFWLQSGGLDARSYGAFAPNGLTVNGGDLSAVATVSMSAVGRAMHNAVMQSTSQVLFAPQSSRLQRQYGELTATAGAAMVAAGAAVIHSRLAADAAMGFVAQGYRAQAAETAIQVLMQAGFSKGGDFFARLPPAEYAVERPPEAWRVERPEELRRVERA